MSLEDATQSVVAFDPVVIAPEISGVWVVAADELAERVSYLGRGRFSGHSEDEVRVVFWRIHRESVAISWCGSNPAVDRRRTRWLCARVARALGMRLDCSMRGRGGGHLAWVVALAGGTGDHLTYLSGSLSSFIRTCASEGTWVGPRPRSRGGGMRAHPARPDLLGYCGAALWARRRPRRVNPLLLEVRRPTHD